MATKNLKKRTTRSKSVHADICREITGFDNDADDSSWKTEDELRLILKVYAQIPCVDNRPFEDEIRYIDWENITLKSYNATQIQNKFNSLLGTARRYRLLTEILEEIHHKKIAQIKKPISSFGIFIRENKEMIKDEMKEENFFKHSSEIFNGLDKNDKTYFEEKKQRMKKKYDDKMKKFKLVKKPPIPKQSKIEISSPFLLYWSEMKKEGKNYFEMRKQYKVMNSSDKLKWILKFLGVRNNEKLTLEQYMRALKHLRKDDLQLIDEYEKRPKRMTAYLLFASKLPKYHGNKKNNLFKTLPKEWRKISEDEKQKLQKEAKLLKISYYKDWKLFIDSLEEGRREFEINRQLKSKKIKKIEKDVKNGNIPESEIPKSKIKRDYKEHEIEDGIENEIKTEVKTEIESENEPKAKKKRKSLSITHNGTEDFKESNKKPPSSLYKYFVLYQYEGPRNLSKNAFKNLTAKELKKLNKKHIKAKTTYLENFEKYLLTLSPQKISKYAEKNDQINSEGDDISDISEAE